MSVMEPVYTYDKTKGWVISTGVEILGERDGFIVVDLADIPGGKGIKRGYAPWHPNYLGTSDNDGKGVEEALRRVGDCNFEVKYPSSMRRVHVCAVRKADYHKLVKFVPTPEFAYAT